MKRFVKNEKGYDKSFDADWKAVKKGLKKVRAEVGEPKKVPTSIALDPRFVSDLKKEAQVRGIPYQVLMRMFIIDGFRRLKKQTA
jgi:predicted DNA binding CopG/RHH family protein